MFSWRQPTIILWKFNLPPITLILELSNKGSSVTNCVTGGECTNGIFCGKSLHLLNVLVCDRGTEIFVDYSLYQYSYRYRCCFGSIHWSIDICWRKWNYVRWIISPICSLVHWRINNRLIYVLGLKKIKHGIKDTTDI